jgi:hypothetical protein
MLAVVAVRGSVVSEGIIVAPVAGLAAVAGVKVTPQALLLGEPLMG